jgi:hypothetical protein
LEWRSQVFAGAEFSGWPFYSLPRSSGAFKFRRFFSFDSIFVSPLGGHPSSFWPDDFLKKSSKIWSNPFFVKINVKLLTLEKSCTKIRAISVIFHNLPKVNNHKMGEISPILGPML